MVRVSIVARFSIKRRGGEGDDVSLSKAASNVQKEKKDQILCYPIQSQTIRSALRSTKVSLGA